MNEVAHQKDHEPIALDFKNQVALVVDRLKTDIASNPKASCEMEIPGNSELFLNRLRIELGRQLSEKGYVIKKVRNAKGYQTEIGEITLGSILQSIRMQLGAENLIEVMGNSIRSIVEKVSELWNTKKISLRLVTSTDTHAPRTAIVTIERLGKKP